MPKRQIRNTPRTISVTRAQRGNPRRGASVVSTPSGFQAMTRCFLWEGELSADMADGADAGFGPHVQNTSGFYIDECEDFKIF